jgi:cysteine dioxygenase
MEAQTLAPARVPLAEFVRGIEQMSHGIITKAGLYEYISSRTIERADLARYENWDPAKHTRNLVFRNENVEVLLICWNVGNVTPLHTHNGQLGWMLMIEGRLRVENHRLLECNRPENQQVVGIDCLAGASYIRMQQLSAEICEPGGPLNTVDKKQTIHRILNPEEWNQRAVSLHVYSRPIESCVVFDLEAQKCYRRELSYDNVPARGSEGPETTVGSQ